MARRARSAAAASVVEPSPTASEAAAPVFAQEDMSSEKPQSAKKDSDMDFWDEFDQFLQANQMEMPRPLIMSKPIDLERMFRIVMGRGGFDGVMGVGYHAWRQVFLECTGATSSSSNTGYYTRLVYERSLLDFELARAAGNWLRPVSTPARPKRQTPKYDDYGSPSRASVTKTTKSSGPGRRPKRTPFSKESSIQFVADGSAVAPLWSDRDDVNSSSDDEAINDADFAALEEDVERQMSVGLLLDPSATEAVREAWFEQCQEHLMSMQKTYFKLNRWLKCTDRNIARIERRPSLGSASSEMENSSEINSLASDNDDAARQNFAQADATSIGQSSDNESDDVDSNTRRRRRKRARI